LVRAPGLEPKTGSEPDRTPTQTLRELRKLLAEQAQKALEGMSRGSSSHASKLLEVLAQSNTEFSTLENEQGFSTLENQDPVQSNSCKTNRNAPPDERKRRSEGQSGG